MRQEASIYYWSKILFYNYWEMEFGILYCRIISVFLFSKTALKNIVIRKVWIPRVLFKFANVFKQRVKIFHVHFVTLNIWFKNIYSNVRMHHFGADVIHATGFARIFSDAKLRFPVPVTYTLLFFKGIIEIK